MTTNQSRLIFVGLDAADARIIRQLAAQGDHLAFANIIERGVAAPVQNPLGLYVGAVWPTFSMGTSPATHGRYCWRQFRAGTYDDEFFQIEQIRGTPAWETIERLGWRTSVVDVPKSLPTPGFKGAIVKDWGTHDPSRGGFQTFGWISRKDFISRYGQDRIGHCDSIPRTLEGFRQLRDDLIERAHTRARMVIDLLMEYRAEVVFSVFSEAHCAGHQCWHLHDSSHELHDRFIRMQVGDPLIDVYAGLDRALRAILAQLTPADTLIVLASHGMGPHYSGVECLTQLTSVVDHGLRGGQQETIHTPHILSVDARWFRERMRIFPVPNNGAYAAFRLNIRGREPNGQVDPAAADALLDEMIQAFLSLYERSARTPIFTKAILTRDVFHGPQEAQLPDLLLEWNRSQPIRTIVSPWGEVSNTDGANPRTGDHTAEGVIWVVGPGAEVKMPSEMEMSEVNAHILKILTRSTRLG
jgi:predicted AlkP superfamily phosphohydrolase/phosphomutase